MCRKPIGHGLFLRCLLGDAGGDACVGIGLDFLLRMTGFVIPGGMQWSVGIFPLFSQCDPAGRRPAMCGRKRMIIIAHSAQLSPHCTGGGIRSDGGSSARSGCAKQRSFLCPLSENRRPIPTEVPCGHFWRHLLVTKSGKNCSSQETPNRRCGMLPDIHSGCFRRFHTPILLKLTIVKDSLFDCGRRAAARSRSMRRAASFRHRRSKHSPPAVGRQTIIQLHIPDGLQSALASESSRISSSGWRADCKNSFVS